MINALNVLNDAMSASSDLLGYKLIHETAEGVTAGMIVETEAYSHNDAASHTFRGQTKRNKVMFGPAGHAYVYFTYGMHHCFNIVTGLKGQGQGVLIRALEPLEGIGLMAKRRSFKDVPPTTYMRSLCSGPAKLVQAMGITKADNGRSILTGQLRIEPYATPAEIVQTTRIGIRKAADMPFRFYIRDNLFVSKP